MHACVYVCMCSVKQTRPLSLIVGVVSSSPRVSEGVALQLNSGNMVCCEGVVVFIPKNPHPFQTVELKCGPCKRDGANKKCALL